MVLHVFKLTSTTYSSLVFFTSILSLIFSFDRVPRRVLKATEAQKLRHFGSDNTTLNHTMAATAKAPAEQPKRPIIGVLFSLFEYCLMVLLCVGFFPVFFLLFTERFNL